MRKKGLKKYRNLTIPVLLSMVVLLFILSLFSLLPAKKSLLSPSASGYNSEPVYAKEPVRSSCIDSDMNSTYPTGLNYYKKGNSNNMLNGLGSIYHDVCLIKSLIGVNSWKYYPVNRCIGADCNLQEAICNGNDVSNIAYKCPYGCIEGACSEQKSPRILRVGVMANIYPLSIDDVLNNAEGLLASKQVDLLIFDENFLEAFSGRRPSIVLSKNGYLYSILSASTPELMQQLNRISSLSRNYQSNTLVVVLAKLPPNQDYYITALFFNTSGGISDIYIKSDPFHLTNFSTKEGLKVTGIMQICNSLSQNYDLYPGTANLDADVLMHSGWGNGGEILPLPVMEYYQTGVVSQGMFDFLANTIGPNFLIRSYQIKSPSDLKGKIQNFTWPFDWILNERNIVFKYKDINPQGAYIVADQISSSGVIRVDGKPLRKVEHGAGYSYVYAEVDLPLR